MKKFSKRLGKCYVLSGAYALDNQDAILVHGSINGISFTDTDFDNPHAWIEEGEVVYDLVLGSRWRKETYYSLMKAKSPKKYTFNETRNHVLATEHWGPWPEER